MSTSYTCNQQTATRSARRRSAGVGSGPVSSPRSNSSLRISPSLNARFSPALALSRDNSACQARSPPHNSANPGSCIILRNKGRVAASPLSARLRNWRTSSGSAGAVASGSLVILVTSLPPLAALVLLKAGGQQRGACHQVGQVVQFVYLAIEGVQFGPVGPPGSPFGFALLALDHVHFRRQLAHAPLPDVLTDNPAVDLRRSRVIAPSLPSHALCYLRTLARFGHSTRPGGGTEGAGAGSPRLLRSLA